MRNQAAEVSISLGFCAQLSLFVCSCEICGTSQKRVCVASTSGERIYIYRWRPLLCTLVGGQSMLSLRSDSCRVSFGAFCSQDSVLLLKPQFVLGPPIFCLMFTEHSPTGDQLHNINLSRISIRAKKCNLQMLTITRNIIHCYFESRHV